jgi:hypothetical protein
MCSHWLTTESSRSSITPGAPAFSIFTESSASSAGPVIWLRWSWHHSGSSTLQAPVVAREGGRYSGSRPWWAASSVFLRPATSCCWRGVNSRCSGEKKSRNPPGSSRTRSRPSGIEFIGG